MLHRTLSQFLRAAFGATGIVLLALAVLHWLELPTGRFIDWLVGLFALWWLSLITTAPWNVYFGARRVLDEADHSMERGITVDLKEHAVIRRVARRALSLSLALHGLSALGLYLLAAYGVSAIGYYGAFAALMLTALRPSVRAYDYLVDRFRRFADEVQFPRPDVVALQATLERLSNQLELDNEDSWASSVGQQLAALRRELETLSARHQRAEQANIQAHEGLQRNYQQSLARVTEDRQVIENLRELFRFIKRA
ncbi:MAG: hypothetical protein AAGI71_15050 [Bacteroidota bacterium]